MRKRRFSKKPLGRATPNKREKIKNAPTAIAKERINEKTNFMDFKRRSMMKDTAKVDTTNFKGSKING
jgi:hypothetical protein